MTELALDTLPQRLDRLEREKPRLKLAESVVVLMLAVSFLVSASSLTAQPIRRDVVRLFNVVPFVTLATPDELREVALSLENRADQRLAWWKVQVVVRNQANEVIYSVPRGC